MYIEIMHRLLERRQNTSDWGWERNIMEGICMIIIREFRPNSRAPKLLVTEPARICTVGAGLIEVTMACSRASAKGLLVVPEEAVRLIWPFEALQEARHIFDIAFARHLQQMRLH